MKILLAFTLLCTLSFGQTQVIPAPLNGHVPLMSVDANGQQTLAAPDYVLEMNAIPLGATSVRIEFQEQDAPHWGVENLTAEPVTINANFGVIHSFTFRPWARRSDYYWQDGYWGEHGEHCQGSDVMPWQWKTPLQNSGVSNQYAVTVHLAPYDGGIDWAGSSGAYGTGPTCNSWISFTITDPMQVAFFKRGDANGKVHFNYNPRALVSMPYSGAAWECAYTTSTSSFLVTAQ